MLKEPAVETEVYLVTGYSDLRKGIEGLEIEQPKAIKEGKPWVLY